MVRASGLHPEGYRFESCTAHHRWRRMDIRRILLESGALLTGPAACTTKLTGGWQWTFCHTTNENSPRFGATAGSSATFCAREKCSMRSPTDEARRWLTHAQDEYGDAQGLRERERFYLALFHFQQAAEKALKAFLYAHTDDRRVFFTHSVLELNWSRLLLFSTPPWPTWRRPAAWISITSPPATRTASLEECCPASILIPMRPLKHRTWPAGSSRSWPGG